LNIEKVLFRVFDTETTGLDVETAKIVEIGACDVWHLHPADAPPGFADFVQSPSQAWLCNPGIPIPPEAKAVHHIIDSDVAIAPLASTVIARLVPNEPTVFVAHNAKYDRPILEREGLPAGEAWLCTYRLAMHVWPEAPSYKNEVLRYWLGFDELPRHTRIGQSVPHRAAHDSAVTALLLREALTRIMVDRKLCDVEALIKWAESPVVLKGNLGFGKYFDKTWAHVAQMDASYFDWMIKQEDREPGSWDMDKIHTARHYRGRLV
jgi:exodeoxyribonuclease X